MGTRTNARVAKIMYIYNMMIKVKTSPLTFDRILIRMVNIGDEWTSKCIEIIKDA